MANTPRLPRRGARRLPREASAPIPPATPSSTAEAEAPAAPQPQSLLASLEYMIDLTQRTILFWDTLRQRGNDFLKHRDKGSPPVLDFHYETILDGRNLERPVNYALLRILPRPDDPIDTHKRPYVVIDPRAGHGPGISGTKQDSQIGIALAAGHPVYFITFFPDPIPGQTILDIKTAKAEFLETIANRHPTASGRPAVVGNCQAGWSVMIVGAARPEVTGPIIVNGTPLAYWGGASERTPMRHRGALSGGTWLASLASDLGGGLFDGAHLVANFEAQNPTHTLWSKPYGLFSRIDTEQSRFLEFEKWWGGFFLMTQEEMEFIVENLFVGNKLHRGGIKLEDGKFLDLRDIKSPMIVFASSGDNITQPMQALQWIPELYPTTKDIQNSGKVIVYMIHPNVGHLGIFVSGAVAKREHSEIIGVLEYLEMLPPGLYEMLISDHEDPSIQELDPSAGRFTVRFEARDVTDITNVEADREGMDTYATVDQMSRWNAELYRSFLRPAIRAMTPPMMAEMLREMHPLRLQRTLISNRNPFCWPFETLAAMARANRQQATDNNPYVLAERALSGMLEAALNTYRDHGDTMREQAFRAIYGAGGLVRLLTRLFGTPHSQGDALPDRTNQAITMPADPEAGGFAEGVVRTIAAVLLRDGPIDRRQFVAGANILKSNSRLGSLTLADYQRLFTDQSAILRKDRAAALAALPRLLQTDNERHEALVAAHSVMMADFHLLSAPDQAVLQEINHVLGSSSSAQA